MANIDWNKENARIAEEQRRAQDRAINEIRETMRRLDQLSNSEGWAWLKTTLAAKADAVRAQAMNRGRADEMARDLGYMSALMDVIKLPEDHTKVLKMQLGNSKL